MLKVGLTGGIGSGKSSVALLFSELGADVIDADVISRELTEPGTEYFEEIAEYFGDDAINNDGTLDRAFVKEKIFEDKEKKQWLEKLLHPAIRTEMDNQLKAVHSDYCLLVIPLLVEAKVHELVDRILVVDAEEKIQIARVKARDSLSDDEAKLIIAAQAEREERLGHADEVIRNNGSMDDLSEQVIQLHEKYSEIAAQGDPGSSPG